MQINLEVLISIVKKNFYTKWWNLNISISLKMMNTKLSGLKGHGALVFLLLDFIEDNALTLIKLGFRIHENMPRLNTWKYQDDD